jgi:threonine synthase
VIFKNMTWTGYLFDPLTDERYPLDEPRWRSDSGGVLSLAIPGFWNPDDLGHREHSMWRYRESLPIQDEQNILTMGEGFTPLLTWNRRGKKIWIKQEHLFPTGSYKDRGAAVLISKVKELGIRQVVQDSSGNAGCAIAAYCGRAGIACDIYVPADTSPAKLMQIRSYGARMHLIPGSREDTAAAALDAARKKYYASHCWNPFFLHGTKTFAYEIWEQLGQRGPDALVLPVGNGTLLLGAYIGFTDLIQRGLIDKLPKLIGVQSGHCAPLATAFQQHATQPALIEKLPTLAEGIAIATPVRGAEILAAVRDSGGYFITVDETEILSTHRALALQGFYVELTAAAAIAGLDHYLELVVETETIVSVFTGHGLKSACEH